MGEINKVSDAGRSRTGCGCPYDEHDPWCPTRNQPPTERDGLHVGDDVLLVPHAGRGGPWPARIIGFTALPDDIVVEWTGLRPFTGSGQNTISRSHVAEVRRTSENASP